VVEIPVQYFLFSTFMTGQCEVFVELYRLV